MRKELDEALCAKYPKIFKDRHGDMRETAMCWGFDCDDGWYNIIDKLCHVIQSHIDQREQQRQYSVDNGKVPTVASVEQVVATQVKEKFGTLRFYYFGGDDTIDGMVRMAESMTEVSCETCGSPGKNRMGGWIRTLCDTHAKEKGYMDED